jgi:hypothetical protein
VANKATDFKSYSPTLLSIHPNYPHPGILNLINPRISVLKDTKEFMVALENKYILILRGKTSYVRER